MDLALQQTTEQVKYRKLVIHYHLTHISSLILAKLEVDSSVLHHQNELEGFSISFSAFNLLLLCPRSALTQHTLIASDIDLLIPITV